MSPVTYFGFKALFWVLMALWFFTVGGKIESDAPLLWTDEGGAERTEV